MTDAHQHKDVTLTIKGVDPVARELFNRACRGYRPRGEVISELMRSYSEEVYGKGCYEAMKEMMFGSPE